MGYYHDCQQMHDRNFRTEREREQKTIKWNSGQQFSKIYNILHLRNSVHSELYKHRDPYPAVKTQNRENEKETFYANYLQ